MDHSREAHVASGARIAALAGRLFRAGLAAVLLATLVRVLVVQPFSIPTGSMAPLLQPGDFLLVNKASYGWSLSSLPSPVARAIATNHAMGGAQAQWRIGGRAPQRGDVILFVGGPVRGIDYVKRVIALPGDRVAIRNGVLFLNGAVIPCLQVTPDLCRETLAPGAGYLVRPGGSGPSEQLPEVEVPAGHYFVMGDNRGDSADSRLSPAQGGLGFVAHDRLVGKASIIYFSLQPESGRPRWERLGWIAG